MRSLTDSGQGNIAGKLRSLTVCSLGGRQIIEHPKKKLKQGVSGWRNKLIDGEMKEERREFRGDGGGGVKKGYGGE